MVEGLVRMVVASAVGLSVREGDNLHVQHHFAPAVFLWRFQGNQITEINGVLGLRQLTHLSLADNRIEEIANLDHLPLKYLNLVS